MKTLIFTLAFAAVLWGCTEETIINMPISSAQPLEFVPIDQPIYNAEAYPGTYKPCYCQPWVCSTPLTVQVPREPGQNMSLFAVDADDNTIETWEMTNLGDDVAYVTIVPEDEVICDQQVRFKVGYITDVGIPPIPYTNISLQKNLPGATTPWTKPGSFATFTVPFGGQSDIVYWSVLLFPGSYKLAYHFTNSNAPTAVTYYAVAMDGDLNVMATFNLGSSITAGTFAGEATLSLPDGCVYLGVGVGVAVVLSSTTITIVDLEFTEATGISAMLYHTDCVEFKESFPDMDMTLIKYWNTKDYDYLHYPSASPFMSFNLWVPAVFWRNRFPEEDEEHTLSNSKVVALSSQIKRQRILKTDHLPDWFHQKIMLVLKHNRVQINGKMWSKKESYTIEGDGSDDVFAFQKATVWLTDSEWVQNNVM